MKKKLTRIIIVFLAAIIYGYLSYSLEATFNFSNSTSVNSTTGETSPIVNGNNSTINYDK